MKMSASEFVVGVACVFAVAAVLDIAESCTKPNPLPGVTVETPAAPARKGPLIPPPAQFVSGGSFGFYRYYDEWQSPTRAIPSTDPSRAGQTPTIGISLSGVTGYQVMVCPPDGGTLTGSGTVEPYVWSYHPGLPNTGLHPWAHGGVPESVTENSANCYLAPQRALSVSTNEIYEPVASAIGTAFTLPDGGTSDAGPVHIFVEAWGAP